MSLTKSELIERLPLRKYTEKAYLDYSMYVILDRALPHICDGLKPVQRRIVYAMSELGLSSKSKHKKSARTVGDVLGKFHPHGDSACYEAMVLMAQSFSSRYPLIDGQGNWGSADDPKSYAAMRYTEAKLTIFAQLFLSELADGTIDWKPNFDGSLREPNLLPARVPSILLNGITGIAVGMATDIPPHNLKEVLDASIYLLDNPDASIEKVCDLLPGPDFPTGAEIISSRTDLQSLYRHGNGSVRMRSVYHLDENEIIVSALPYQVSPARIVEQIASQMHLRKLPMLVDLRDESDHEHSVRLVLTLRSSKVDSEELMQHLFATTDLEKSIRVNINVIGVNGRPQVKSLIELLKEWLVWRREVVTKRTENRLSSINDRLHLLEGFILAFSQIDKIIMLIRTEDDPKRSLIQNLSCTEEQASAILDLRLKNLANLEEKKLYEEREVLLAERTDLMIILSSSSQMTKLLREELKLVSNEYGDMRRSKIVVRKEAKGFSHKKSVMPEPITIILSEQGWIRMARGVDIDPKSLSYRSGDNFLVSTHGKLSDTLVVFDQKGRAYTLSAYDLPSSRGQGEPLSGRVDLQSNQKVTALALGDLTCSWLLATGNGYGFICSHKDLVGRNRKGKNIVQITSLPLLQPLKISEGKQNDVVACALSTGNLLLFDCNEIPKLSKGRGNRLISMSRLQSQSGHQLVSLIILANTSSLRVYAGKRHVTLTRNDLNGFKGKRGSRGLLLPRGLQRVDRLEEII